MKQTKQYEYVDLGLPSGLKWAKCNVGAEKETDYGYYFQWGSVTSNTADKCTWSSYKHCNGSYTTLTKYCTDRLYGTVDNKTTLDLEDDAVRAHMGGDWRMPTQDEIQELIDNTDHVWIEDYNGTGVNGRKFTSKTDTSKYIFIPATFNCHYGLSYYVGFLGGVWSSSLVTSRPNYACGLLFNPGNCYINYYNRYSGRSVRGVCK